jgi:hypothetical protein
MAFCDMVLLAQPVSGSTYDLSSFGAMPDVSAFRASLGSLLGIVCAFFICFGFWHLKEMFEPGKPRLALGMFAAFCSVEFFGGAFHAAYYFLSGEHFVRPDVLITYTAHLERLSWLGVPGYITGTILFFWFASDKKYPVWFRFTNPLVIQGAFLLVFTILPAPLGGYLKPTFMNIGFAVFFFSALLVRDEHSLSTR